MGKIRKDIVDFHGKMVLLENYSNINYTGGLLRLPFIQKVLEQPFFTTDLVSKLVKECESTMDAVFPVDKKLQDEEEEEDRKEGRQQAIRVAGDGIFRNTVVALVTMPEIRRGSSTYGQFSLPPLVLTDSDLIHAFQLINSPVSIV